MTVRQANRLGEFARFLKYLPRIYRAHVLECQRRFSGLEGDPRVLFFDRDVHLVTPNDVSTHTVWREFMASADGFHELRAFRRLARGCRNLLDIGAAQGLFSAVFARTADHPIRIVAVEPTQEVGRLHQQTAAWNARNGLDWQVQRVALSDRTAITTLGSDVLDGHFCQYADKLDLAQTLQVTTLDTLCNSLNFVPDLIKMDIDSFEFEVLTGSPDFLARHRPKVHFELHPNDLRRRGKDPAKVIALVERSHRIAESLPRDYLRATVARLTLLPK
jgi:FkbM family methyltransferase